MASTIKRNTNSPKSGSLNTFPTHVIWTKDERFAYRLRTPPPPSDSPSSSVKEHENKTEETGAGESEVETGASTVNPIQRINRLERNIQFLQTQHKLMLRSLHAEIETLNVKNKDLQFKLIIGLPLIAEEEEKEVRTKVSRNSSTQTEDLVPLKDKFRRFSHMEGELSSLRLALEDAENRNSSLSNLVSQLKSSHMKLKSKSANNIIVDMNSSKNTTVPRLQEVNVPLAYSKKFEEYESIVRGLRKENVEQKKELEQVRSSLDNYRSAVRNNSSKQKSEMERLPKIPQPLQTARPNQARKTTELPYIHPVQTVYREDSAFRDKRYASGRDRLRGETEEQPDRERRASDTSWIRKKPPQRRLKSDHNYDDRNLESKPNRETSEQDNW